MRVRGTHNHKHHHSSFYSLFIVVSQKVFQQIIQLETVIKRNYMVKEKEKEMSERKQEK